MFWKKYTKRCKWKK